MKDSKETVTQIKNQKPEVDLGPILTRLEELEERCTQLETTLKDTITFEKLAARLTGKKTIKNRRAKREWSEEEKKAFHERMVAAREAKDKARQEASNTEVKKK
ncbi:MAG: hypothetical protein JSV42_10315 [Chloroflexota bacterium]|nr:MAG: hypothetical protein JSV42_10315 [Chloroflexota bacterium]